MLFHWNELWTFNNGLQNTRTYIQKHAFSHSSFTCIHLRFHFPFKSTLCIWSICMCVCVLPKKKMWKAKKKKICNNATKGKDESNENGCNDEKDETIRRNFIKIILNVLTKKRLKKEVIWGAELHAYTRHRLPCLPSWMKVHKISEHFQWTIDLRRTVHLMRFPYGHSYLIKMLMMCANTHRYTNL